MILGRLFNKVIIPPSVNMEWLRPDSYIAPDWLCVRKLSDSAMLTAEKLYLKMDKGEADAIALFSEIQADLILLDDLKSRKYALTQGLPLTGTAGILVIAKNKGLIPELKPVLELLRNHNLFLSEEVFEKALLLANEI